jgi:hypothetical protein
MTSKAKETPKNSPETSGSDGGEAKLEQIRFSPEEEAVSISIFNFYDIPTEYPSRHF